MPLDRRLHVSKIGRLLSSSSQVIPSSSQPDDIGQLSQEQKQQGFEEDDTGFIFKRASQEEIGKVSQINDSINSRSTKRRKKQRLGKTIKDSKSSALFMKGKEITKGLDELLNRSISQQAERPKKTAGKSSKSRKAKVKRNNIKHIKQPRDKKTEKEMPRSDDTAKNSLSQKKHIQLSGGPPTKKRVKKYSESTTPSEPESTLLDVLEYENISDENNDNSNLLVSSGDDTDQVFSLDDDVDDSVYREETYDQKPEELNVKRHKNSLELNFIDRSTHSNDDNMALQDAPDFYETDAFHVDEPTEQVSDNLDNSHVSNLQNANVSEYLAATGDPIIDVASKIPLKESVERQSQDQSTTAKFSRRSSLSNRGKRLSSIGNGFVAEPHSEVPIEQFYKHFDKDLPDPHKMRQLLVWCCRRIDFGGTSKNDHLAASLAEKIKQKLINDLINGKIDINLWRSSPVQNSSSNEASKEISGTNTGFNSDNIDSQFNKTEKAKQPIVVKPNDANIRNMKLLREYKSKLERLKKEENAWKKAAATLPVSMEEQSRENAIDLNESDDLQVQNALESLKSVSEKTDQKRYSIILADMIERIKLNVHKLKKSDAAISLVVEKKMKELSQVLKKSTDLTNDEGLDPKMLLQALAETNLLS